MSPRDVTVRPALHKDISALTGMARALAETLGRRPDLLDKDAIASLLFGTDRWAEALIAFDPDHRALGYITFSRKFEPHSGARALIVGDFYVMAGRRGQGIGRLLLQAVAKRAVSQKCRALLCDVRTDNQAALTVFRRALGDPDGSIRPFRLEGDQLRDLAQG